MSMEDCRAWVRFKVECKATKLGEVVYVCGSEEALGSWKTAHALQMATNEKDFPEWSSQPVMLPMHQSIEYKYVILKEADMAVVKWESFNGNHKVAVKDVSVDVKSVWDQPKVATATTVPPDEMTPRDGPYAHDDIHDDDDLHGKEVTMPLAGENGEAAHGKVSGDVGMSPSSRDNAAAGVVEVADDLAGLKRSSSRATFFRDDIKQMEEEVQNRDVMRRNFSQSLFLAHESEAEEEVAPKEPQASDVQVIQGALPDDEEEDHLQPPPKTTSLRGVPLQHITSFSALTELSSVEAKEEARKKVKVQPKYDRYEPFNRDVPVVVITSEVAPYSKSGGLGLVAGSYSYEFPRNGHRTMVCSPKYKHYDGITFVGEKDVLVSGRTERVKYWHKYMPVHEGNGCDFIFIEHTSIERGGGLYNDDGGREYHDNLFRFTISAAAAMEAPLILELPDHRKGGQRSKYGDKVVFLANDWQAGVVPVYLCDKYRRNNTYTQSRCVYVIHNLGYQGQYPNINAAHFFGLNDQAAQDISLGNCVNLMKGALICADRVLTVSPNYAREITTREGGFGLDHFVREKANRQRLAGILNGIDDCWNPETDEKIKRRYSVETFVESKKFNKVELQKALGLAQDPNVVLLGFVGRLTWQKGVDVLSEVVPWLMADTGNRVTGRCQLIMMGQGEEKYAAALRGAENSFRGRVCGYVGFDPNVEHQMMAGCDLFIMPSRYEPCGLPQMYSQQYGTLPVVSATGGLVDSVIDVSAGVDKATGFHIPYTNADKMKEVMYKAMDLFHNRPEDFRCMQRTAMQTDFFWPRAMDQYEANIDYTLYDPPNQR